MGITAAGAPLSAELGSGVALEGNSETKQKQRVLSLELQIKWQQGHSLGRREVWRR